MRLHLGRGHHDMVVACSFRDLQPLHTRKRCPCEKALSGINFASGVKSDRIFSAPLVKEWMPTGQPLHLVKFIDVTSAAVHRHFLKFESRLLSLRSQSKPKSVAQMSLRQSLLLSTCLLSLTIGLPSRIAHHHCPTRASHLSRNPM